MTACSDYEPLLLDRSCGVLDADGAARLDAHLMSCAACRAEARAVGDVLALVALPAPAAAEVQALDGLADSLRPAPRLVALRRHWPSFRFGALALTAAAAALLLTLGTPLLSRPPAPDHALLASPQPSAEAWRGPDFADGWADDDADDASVSELGADEVAMAEALADDDGYDP